MKKNRVAKVDSSYDPMRRVEVEQKLAERDAFYEAASVPKRVVDVMMDIGVKGPDIDPSMMNAFDFPVSEVLDSYPEPHDDDDEVLALRLEYLKTPVSKTIEQIVPSVLVQPPVAQPVVVEPVPQVPLVTEVPTSVPNFEVPNFVKPYEVKGEITNSPGHCSIHDMMYADFCRYCHWTSHNLDRNRCNHKKTRRRLKTFCIQSSSMALGVSCILFFLCKTIPSSGKNLWSNSPSCR
jgi:hypothetical protein